MNSESRCKDLPYEAAPKMDHIDRPGSNSAENSGTVVPAPRGRVSLEVVERASLRLGQFFDRFDDLIDRAHAALSAAPRFALELVRDGGEACIECGDELEPGLLVALDEDEVPRCLVCAGELLRADTARDGGAA